MGIKKRKILVSIFLFLFIGYLGFVCIKTIVFYIYFKFPKCYYTDVSEEELGVPVLMYHTVKPHSFEKDLNYLKNNHYHTLTADAFFQFIRTGEKPGKRCVLITFDDGRKSLYRVAYPLLKQYGMHATAFILPYRANHPPDVNYNSKDDLYEQHFDGQSFISWNEILEMYQSGTIDIQSHTLNQYSIPISDNIIDFYHPEYRLGFALDRLPIYSQHEFEFSHDHSIGRPIYEYASRFNGFPAYFEDLQLSEYCTQFVKNHGGKEFFKKKHWKSSLLSEVEKYIGTYGCSDSMETYEDMKTNLIQILSESKNQIESKIPGHAVQYLATPWGDNSRITIDMARLCGYKGIFITDQIGKRSCYHRDDPFNLPRLDVNKDMVFSLPGKGRKSFLNRFLSKWIYCFIHPCTI